MRDKNPYRHRADKDTYRHDRRAYSLSRMFQKCNIIIGPGHAKTCLMPYANDKGADQPTHPCSLIVVRCLDSMIYILAISKVSKF